MSLYCVICRTKIEKGVFCEYHQEAYENILDRFPVWEKALKISWKGYLSQIAKNALAGKWVKEVVAYLEANEEKQNVKKS